MVPNNLIIASDDLYSKSSGEAAPFLLVVFHFFSFLFFDVFTLEDLVLFDLDEAESDASD